MLGGILDYLGSAMTFQGVLLMAWAAILVTDALVVKKLLKIVPKEYEARQEKLYKWNPARGCTINCFKCSWNDCSLRLYGNIFTKYSNFLCSHFSFNSYGSIAVYTKGKYYSKDESKEIAGIQQKKEKRESGQHTQMKFQLSNADNGNGYR